MDPFETLTATQSPVDPFGTPPATPRPAADVADFVNALWKVRAERATGAPKARQAESTPAQAEHARWQMVESPGCARSAPLERRRRDGRSARQRRRSTLAHGGVTGEARIILRSPIHMSSCTRTCTRVHVAKIVSVATGTPCTVLKSEKKVNGHGLFFCCALRASQNFWPIRGEIGVKPHSDQLIGVG